MKGKKREDNVGDAVIRTASIMFVLFMIALFPLIFHDKYFDITNTKLKVLKMVFCLLTVAFLCTRVMKVVEMGSAFLPSVKRVSFSVTDVFALVFAVVLVVSSIGCDDTQEAFLGLMGRKMGAIIFLICIVIYFWVSRYYQFSEKHMWFLIISNVIMWILIVFDFWGVDLLSMKVGIPPGDWWTFTGTMGNINVSSGYGSVLVSIYMTGYWLSETKFSRRIYFFMITLGFYVCYATRSESWILGTGIASLILFWKSFENNASFEKFLNVWKGFVLGSVLMRVTVWIMPENIYSQGTINQLQAQKVASFLLKNEMLVFQILLIILGSYVVRNKTCILLKRIRNILFGLLGAGLAGAAVMLVICNATHGNEEWRKYFTITDSFGSSRGYIWTRALRSFKKMSAFQKSFGFGPNCFMQFIYQWYGEEIDRNYNTIFRDAHNEIIQFLSTTGIMGVTAYFGMQISIVVKCMIRQKENIVLLLGGTAIAAYIGQGMFNNPSVFLTPFLFVLMGIAESGLRHVKTTPKDC